MTQPIKSHHRSMKTGQGKVRNRIRWTPAVIRKTATPKLIEVWESVITNIRLARDGKSVLPSLLARSKKIAPIARAELLRRGFEADEIDYEAGDAT
jgi:hypothetical protein